MKYYDLIISLLFTCWWLQIKITSCRGNQQFNFFFSSKRPDFKNGISQLHVCLIHFFSRSHFDAKVFSNQGKKRCGKIDLTLLVQWHIHSYQFFVGQTVWTFGSEPEWRIHILQHVVHFRVVNTTTNDRDEDENWYFFREIDFTEKMIFFFVKLIWWKKWNFSSWNLIILKSYVALGSYSAQIRINSSRWWAPKMEESRVR